MGGEAREMEGESEGGMEGGIPQINQLVSHLINGKSYQPKIKKLECFNFTNKH